MDDTGIDQVMDIPDTPERLSARNVSHGNFCGKRRGVSVADHLSFTNEECPQQLKNGIGLDSEDGSSGRQCTHPPSRTQVIIDDCKHISNNASENFHSAQSSHMFRRKMLGRKSKDEERLNMRTEHLDKGKKLRFAVPNKSSSCAKDNALSDLILPNKHSEMLEMAFPSSASNNIADEQRKGKEVTRDASSLQCAPNSKISSVYAYKGKEKVADYSREGSGSAIDQLKQIDHMNNSQVKHAKEISLPASSAISTGVNGRKRLVRNGCISPHNIAIRDRQVAECNRTYPENVDMNTTSIEIGHSALCPVDISDIISDDRNGTRDYGRTAFHPSRINGRLGARHPSIERNNDGMPCRSNDVSGRDMDSHNTEQTNTGNDISSVECAISRDHAAQKHSGLLSNSNQIIRPSHAASSLPAASSLSKRQKKHGATNKNHGESSTSVLGDSEIECTDSNRISRNLRSSGSRFSRTQHPVIEIDDFSPVMRHSNSQSVGCVETDDTIARVSQIEADEMLARELQEQLYYEESVSSAGDVDERIAWALQLEERATNTGSRERQVISGPRAPSMALPHRQSLSQPVRNTSNRRGSRPRGPSSSRMAQLRNRFRRQTPVLPRGGNLLEFPFDMDLDMRIDILEALEAADGDLDTGLDNHILQFQQNFNVNDYETLLALDENNNHTGASGSQINSLPLSTVQNENCEICAICLETPSVGDTIRHLPCLHKFHKDCIDPWLSRKTSCPVCKSSITDC